MIEDHQPQYKHYYWGIPDSPIDWCELNYDISPFICEFYNTISSFGITLFAIYGALLLLFPLGSNLLPHQIRMGNLKATRNKALVAFAALSTVGIGSAFYHATLLYKHQLFDEFPMVISVCCFLYCLFTIDPVSKADSKYYKLFRFLLPYLLAIYFVVVASTIYVIRNIPTILQASFGILVVTLVAISAIICRSIPVPLKQCNPKKLLLFAATSMGTAYICWLIERKLCQDGYVIPGLQLHAIWHILTGLAGFYWMQFYLCLSMEKNGYKTSIHYNWLGVGDVRGFIKT
ncbi:hypothetical protein SAMD00019534_019500 [Acytostelium subglobosum LB1]|uniref:hypothetical protein n=1 Tax=Acytostelium subglobosum LB1 TaxID=1410327 RepID=UPI000644DE2A|nr:hypothetical protein SAMD00019534_019500 [Acytostelium subglobosum LB1]GAM18775.1 hypothetical protein SAMD00019534_019500 [Acytostelium subglobosum LB1]|eukprot:XP_012757995.1 hypothetical protein SAMD00019534_019500 [Acytostelium subglobosum LB1]